MAGAPSDKVKGCKRGSEWRRESARRHGVNKVGMKRSHSALNQTRTGPSSGPNFHSRRTEWVPISPRPTGHTRQTTDIDAIIAHRSRLTEPFLRKRTRKKQAKVSLSHDSYGREKRRPRSKLSRVSCVCVL